MIKRATTRYTNRIMKHTNKEQESWTAQLLVGGELTVEQ